MQNIPMLENVSRKTIFMLATAIYLILGFCFDMWHPGWIVFVLAAVVSSLLLNTEKTVTTQNVNET